MFISKFSALPLDNAISNSSLHVQTLELSNWKLESILFCFLVEFKRKKIKLW